MHYWESTDLDLHFVSKTDCSVDENGAKRYKVKATVAEQFVTELQTDLIALGYLEDKSGNKDGYFGGGLKRAVIRFQRHALRTFRMKSDKARIDLAATEQFSGSKDGIVTQAVATEIRRWVDQGWVVPVGVVALEKIEPNDIGVNPKLRADARAAWQAIMQSVSDAGGTLEGKYGDVFRSLQKSSKVGTSLYSVHYCGRAVDIAQTLYGVGKTKRYVAKKETIDSKTYWVLYCKTALQDGTQGAKIEKGEFKYITSFAGGAQADVPAGYYINLTEMIEAGGFSRIKAQTGWESSYNKTEWWHFQFNADLQATFQDELELIGYDEKKIRAAGWKTDAELDHAPG